VRIWVMVSIQEPFQHFQHFSTFPFVHYECLKLCSAAVHFIWNNCFYFFYCGWSAQALTALATLPISAAWSNCGTSAKTAVVKREAFRHLTFSQQPIRNTKICWISMYNKKAKVFWHTLCAFSVLV